MKDVIFPNNFVSLFKLKVLNLVYSKFINKLHSHEREQRITYSIEFAIGR